MLSCVKDINPNLKCFFIDGVDGVSLDGGLPFALARFVGEQIALDITERQKKNK